MILTKMIWTNDFMFSTIFELDVILLAFFLELGIGSYCFRASGFFVFPSVGRACFFFEKTFVCDKKDKNYIQKP